MRNGQQGICDIGSRRELFVDHYLIDGLEGVGLVMAQPKNEGIVLQFDKPWEGKYTAYGTVMKLTDDHYRLYYSGCPLYNSDTDLERQGCVAFSKDGINWERPDLGLFEAYGTRDNNIILTDPQFALNFAPFLDTRKGVAESQRFKSVGGTRFSGMVMFSSHDGIRWEKMFGGKAVMNGDYLDSKNVVFWSESENCYVMYARLWQGGWEGYRWIGRATSDDLEHWTDLEPVRILHDGRDVPPEHYYHSGTTPYFRAPHIYVALCSQLTEQRAVSDDQIAALGLDDTTRADARSGGGLMTSRGGGIFQRTFMEEFIRPPMGPENWLARCNYPAVGIVRTGTSEMSIYTHTHMGLSVPVVRRYTLRLDGFASLRAPFAGGQMVTKPLAFEGNELSINFATSSRGYIRIQFETPDYEPIEGFSINDCTEIVGNEIARRVSFNGSADLSKLSGRPLRLRVVMKDADLYSLAFQSSPAE